MKLIKTDRIKKKSRLNVSFEETTSFDFKQRCVYQKEIKLNLCKIFSIVIFNGLYLLD